MNILFVCSRNQWRSSTAEALYKGISGLHARSAGTEPSARIRLNEKMLGWADVVFAMEKRHKERIRQQFPDVVHSKIILVMDIPDKYQFMDEELIAMIRSCVDSYLNGLPH